MSDLLLDGRNPRHDPARTQTTTLAALLADEGPKIKTLGKDIAENGLSPIDAFLVLERSPSSHIVLEGNRRLAAIKLLGDPSLSSDPRLRADFAGFKAKMAAPVEQVQCHIVATRAEATHWQELRHRGQSNGRGTVPWNAEAVARFFGATTGQTAKAIIFVDALRKAYPKNTRMRADLDRVMRDKSSTLGRLIGDPDARAGLGVELLPEFGAYYASEELEPLFMRLAADFASRLSVSDLKRKAQRVAYMSTIASLMPDPRKRQARASPLAAVVGPPPSLPPAAPYAPPSAPTVPTPASPVSPTPSPVRPRRLFEGVRLPKMSARIQDILGELQRLDVDSKNGYPNAAAVLMRVVIELAVAEVFTAKTWPTQIVRANGRTLDKTLAEKLRECLSVIDVTGKDKKWKAVRVGLSAPDDILSVSTLNAWVHNSGYHPVPSHLRSVAANYGEFLSALGDLV